MMKARLSFPFPLFSLAVALSDGASQQMDARSVSTMSHRES